MSRRLQATVRRIDPHSAEGKMIIERLEKAGRPGTTTLTEDIIGKK